MAPLCDLGLEPRVSAVTRLEEPRRTLLLLTTPFVPGSGWAWSQPRMAGRAGVALLLAALGGAAGQRRDGESGGVNRENRGGTG